MLNPYRPPTPITADPATLSRISEADRSTMVSRVRWSLAILLIPGLINFVAFDQRFVDVPSHRSIEILWYRFVNVTLFASLVIGIWFLGTRVLFAMSDGIRRVAAVSNREAWQQAFCQSFRPAIATASIGAALWLFWIYAIYARDWNDFVVSTAVAIVAHFLAFRIYVPLISRWWRLWRDERRRISPERRTV